MTDHLTSKTLAEQLRAIARAVYNTNAFRSGEIDFLADEVERLEAELSTIEGVHAEALKLLERPADEPTSALRHCNTQLKAEVEASHRDTDSWRKECARLLAVQQQIRSVVTRVIEQSLGTAYGIDWHALLKTIDSTLTGASASPAASEDTERLNLIAEEQNRRLAEQVDQLEAEIERLRASEPPNDDVLRRIDRAYYDGARQASAMAHQSLAAMDEWIAGGCGGRGPVTKSEGAS